MFTVIARMQLIKLPIADKFCKYIFLPTKGEDQKKKSYHLSSRPLALSHVVNSPLVVALRWRLDESLRTKTLNFTRVSHVN